jgi:hypothetical protein
MNLNQIKMNFLKSFEVEENQGFDLIFRKHKFFHNLFLV